MEEGSIVRISLPQSDGKLRSRPALLLKKVSPFNDWILCSISSKLHNEVKGLDFILDSNHEDFNSSHLKFSGLIRVANLFTIPESIIEGKIGFISSKSYKIILQNLSNFVLSTKGQ